ncbi:GNAT family N-acetyltransferase [Cellulosimicrobium arenosum]|uniref:GNAT family N-acetyltransferase n=1 Tax=Cellulosimicrobium arenosum TaxID=2708133 RepID=A0A927IYR4_9MICO|nr:GNAT family N-acetyltransferase [Cellulosimicrobium arenosum]
MRIVELAAGDPRWESALPVLQELRPHLTVELLAQVLADDAPGPRFLAAFESVPDAATAAPSAPAVCLGVAGWRVIANTSTGRKLYVDDLVTASGVRSGGVGAALLGELERRARAAGCTVLDLDSGVQRFDAHRFYLRERLSIVSHHFAKTL